MLQKNDSAAGDLPCYMHYWSNNHPAGARRNATRHWPERPESDRRRADAQANRAQRYAGLSAAAPRFPVWGSRGRAYVWRARAYSPHPRRHDFVCSRHGDDATRSRACAPTVQCKCRGRPSERACVHPYSKRAACACVCVWRLCMSKNCRRTLLRYNGNAHN